MKKNVLVTAGAMLLAIAVLTALAACESAEDLMKKGDDLTAAGNFAQAAGFYSKAIQQEASARLYMSRSAAYAALDDSAAALEDLNKAIALDQNYGDAYAARGGLYYESGDYANAARDLERYAQSGAGGASVKDMLTVCNLQ
jgi:tetratricopeptide (TPR) repeat protein